jgi:hypothetical protein
MFPHIAEFQMTDRRRHGGLRIANDGELPNQPSKPAPESYLLRASFVIIGAVLTHVLWHCTAPWRGPRGGALGRIGAHQGWVTPRR